MKNVTDGVANPVLHGKRYGRGCKPRPAWKTLRTGLQTPSGMENVTDGVANPVRHEKSDFFKKSDFFPRGEKSDFSKKSDFFCFATSWKTFSLLL
jgi:hypothetical protein